MGRISDRFDRRTVLIIAAACTIISAIAVIWATGQSIVILMGAIALYGGFSFTIYAISASQVNDMADRSKLVQISAGLLIAYGVGASIGPLVAAKFMSVAGPNGFFMFLIGINCLLIAFTIIRMFQRRRHTNHKSRFMPFGGFNISSKQLYTAAISAEQEMPEDVKPEENKK